MSDGAQAVLTRGRFGAWTTPERLLLLAPLLFLAVLFIYPLTDMVIASFEGEGVFGAYRDVLSDDIFIRAALRTLFVAVFCTAVALLLGFPIAYEVTRPQTRARLVLLAIVIITFWVSVLIRAYSWIAILEPGGVFDTVLAGVLFLDSAGLQQNVWAVSIGMTHFLLPYMILVLIPALRALDPDLINAAHSLGAGRWRTLFRVVLPMTWGAILAGCLLVFILALGFFVMPAILGGPAVPFTANLIGQQVGQFQNFEIASAMGVLLTLSVLTMYVILLRFVDPGKILGGSNE